MRTLVSKENKICRVFYLFYFICLVCICKILSYFIRYILIFILERLMSDLSNMYAR